VKRQNIRLLLWAKVKWKIQIYIIRQPKLVINYKKVKTMARKIEKMVQNMMIVGKLSEKKFKKWLLKLISTLFSNRFKRNKQKINPHFS